ncbi:hypothetical protein F2Q70_00026884 [Brassica cretica]|uniref:Uncharacterized protein n=1 Tax=Brassica cretica TaxID=69181 RepID=A0A8S9L3X6_BRACR|nr:hypothetical protein F2Q70_00026884 [Brassica cretica]
MLHVPDAKSSIGTYCLEIGRQHHWIRGRIHPNSASWTTSLLSWVSWESGQLSWMDCWKLGPMCQFWAVTWPIGWSMMAMGRWALGIGPGAWATSLGLSVTCLGAVSPVRDVW